MNTHQKDIGLLILRITFGIMLFLHGFFKVLNGIGFIKNGLAGHGIPEFFAYAVYFGEVVGPLLIVMGWRARSGALLIIGNMTTAILLVHSSQILSLNKAGGWAVELPALFLFGALTIFITGAGKYAVSQSSWWD